MTFLFKQNLSMHIHPKKTHKSYSKKSCTQKNHVLHFGTVGLKALQNTRLTQAQIKSFEWAITRLLKSQKDCVKSWSKFNLNLTLTKLNLESRMGKGKGNISTSAQFLQAGTIFFEFSELSKPSKKKINSSLSKIFPVKFKLVQETQRERNSKVEC